MRRPRSRRCETAGESWSDDTGWARLPNKPRGAHIQAISGSRGGRNTKVRAVTNCGAEIPSQGFEVEPLHIHPARLQPASWLRAEMAPKVEKWERQRQCKHAHRGREAQIGGAQVLGPAGPASADHGHEVGDPKGHRHADRHERPQALGREAVLADPHAPRDRGEHRQRENPERQHQRPASPGWGSWRHRRRGSRRGRRRSSQQRRRATPAWRCRSPPTAPRRPRG